ncbi:MAG TPA: helix-turn-helix domain-containing protein, partial [Dissulfurispiraceae bacterium]|nr:helix-turn-helix domain-containing protein [Dissulfurispiraceae bacterium]
WEGNVRELENVLYRMAVLARSDTLLPPAGEASAESFAGSEAATGGTMRDVERDVIIKTLKSMKGNRTKTAEVLGVSVRTIRNKIKEYNITDL